MGGNIQEEDVATIYNQRLLTEPFWQKKKTEKPGGLVLYEIKKEPIFINM